MLAESRLEGADRLSLMGDVPAIFRRRWLPWMLREAMQLRGDLPALMDRLRAAERVQAGWMARALIDALHGVAAIVPEVDLTADRLEIIALAGAWCDQAEVVA
jgi:hypothetical protein